MRIRMTLRSAAWIGKAISDRGAAVGIGATMPAYKDLRAAKVKEMFEYIKKPG